jgi:hypothetical protein
MSVVRPLFVTAIFGKIAYKYHKCHQPTIFAQLEEAPQQICPARGGIMDTVLQLEGA